MKKILFIIFPYVLIYFSIFFLSDSFKWWEIIIMTFFYISIFQLILIFLGESNDSWKFTKFLFCDFLEWHKPSKNDVFPKILTEETNSKKLITICSRCGKEIFVDKEYYFDNFNTTESHLINFDYSRKFSSFLERLCLGFVFIVTNFLFFLLFPKLAFKFLKSIWRENERI